MTADVALKLQSNGARMPLPARFMLYFVIWLIAEVAAFFMIVEILSVGGAVLLCMMTSLVGAAMLRRLGLSAAFRLRKALVARSYEEGGFSREALLDGTLAGLGSILLILPGFVSDFIGLALAAPSMRIWVTERLQFGKFGASQARRAGPEVIELGPQDWSRLDESCAPTPRAKPRKPRVQELEDRPIKKGDRAFQDMP